MGREKEMNDTVNLDKIFFENNDLNKVDAEKIRREFAVKFPDLFPEVYSPTVQQALYLSNNKTIVSYYK